MSADVERGGARAQVRLRRTQHVNTVRSRSYVTVQPLGCASEQGVFNGGGTEDQEGTLVERRVWLDKGVGR